MTSISVCPPLKPVSWAILTPSPGILSSGLVHATLKVCATGRQWSKIQFSQMRFRRLWRVHYLDIWVVWHSQGYCDPYQEGVGQEVLPTPPGTALWYGTFIDVWYVKPNNSPSSIYIRWLFFYSNLVKTWIVPNIL